jgi:DNA-binding response OmpR family regulator
MQPSEENNSSGIENSRTGPGILIYDDDPEILFLCKAILNNYNYRVKTLTSCEDVVADVQRLKPSLVLMDLWIPEIGGEKAIRLLKDHPETKEIPVIIFSANSEIKEICRKIDADGYLEKPFDIDHLKEIIENHVS